MKDQHIVVTGAGSGIGRATARLAAARGARVAVLDQDADAAEQVARELQGHDVAALQCDVTDGNALGETLDHAEELFGPVTGLLTAAGIDRSGMAHELPEQTWRQVVEVNLTGTFLTAKAVLSRMVERHTRGALVLCSSPAAFVGFAAGGASAYSASKGGVSALTRSLAVDYARHGIRVNALVPGSTETPLMWASVPAAERDSVRRQIEQEIPIGRLADPDEPAMAAIWLLGAEAAYVTGTHLVCDGGVLAKASISV